jgi:hypothetical protein
MLTLYASLLLLPAWIWLAGPIIHFLQPTLTFEYGGWHDVVEGALSVTLHPLGLHRYMWSGLFSLFLTSGWVWLYVVAGFLLIASRRLDLGFDWFNGHADIEHKPLQSIGLVAGSLVAVVYWSAVVVSRVVK